MVAFRKKPLARSIRHLNSEQRRAMGVRGNIAWVAESKFALRDDPNNRDPGPWLIMPAALPQE
jgi:hypothetical protein